MTQTWVYFHAFKALLEQQDALCGSDSDFLFLLDLELQHRRSVIPVIIWDTLIVGKMIIRAAS